MLIFKSNTYIFVKNLPRKAFSKSETENQNQAALPRPKPGACAPLINIHNCNKILFEKT
jgi:hypothetical protein